MFVRNPSVSLTQWGRASLLSALLGLPVFASCTKSEDTEPYVPAKEGATQPGAEGALLSEADACDRLRAAYEGAYDDLGCDLPEPPECPSFIRPGAGSGCFEYYEGSVAACEKAYEEARSCGSLTACIVSAQRNDELSTCVLPDDGGGATGGQGNTDQGGAPSLGGMTATDEGGAPTTMAGASPGVGGSPDVPAGGAGG